MSMTRETRRERVRRLADVPDAHIHIKWGTIGALGLAVVSIITWTLLLAWMVGDFIDRL